MLLFIVRHGEPIYGPDILTEKGQKQAQALVKRFTVHGLDRIYSSPKGRAQQTGAPTAEALQLPVAIESWMSEDLAWDAFSVPRANGNLTWSYSREFVEEMMDGQFARMNTKEILSTYFARVPDPDYFYNVVSHSDDFLARQGFVREGDHYIANIDREERVAAFCHGGFGTLWLSHLTGIPLHRFASAFSLDHTGVTVVHFDPKPGKKIYPEFISLNDLGHLRDSEAPYVASNRFEL